MGGGWLMGEEDVAAWTARLGQGVALAATFGVHDLSIYPPYMAAEADGAARTACAGRLARLLDVWLPRAQAHGATLTLETHVSPGVFSV